MIHGGLLIRTARLRAALVAAVLLLATAGLGVTAASAHARTSGVAQTDRPGDEPPGDGDGGDGGEEDEDDGGPAAPADYLTQRFTSNQDVTTAQVRRSIAQAAALPSTSGRWSLVGPTNIGGRVVDLAVDPNHPDTVYIAASGGGVWKSTDGGATFASAWPTHVTQTLGALAMGPNGTLWAGTGEANPSGGGLTFFGNGVYRSTDGGASWKFWGLPDSGSIGRIVVDPTDPARVWVAATGNLSGTAGQRGVYVLDGGKNWRQVLSTPNTTTGAVDLAMDPTKPSRVYAALWDHQRNSGARVYGGVGSGLFRTDDSGASWTRLQNIRGVADTDETGSGLTRDKTLGRIGVAIAPSDPNRVYVITATQYGLDKGFYVSTNHGQSFRPSGRAGGDSGYAWWFGRLWVDPADENHLFSADVALRESTDGGRTWDESEGVHADQHALQWDPREPGHVYLGNDGGVYHSADNGDTDSWVHATYEPWNQSYHLAVAADDPSRLASGLQDNGSVRTWTPTSEPTDLTQWNAYGGGDGHEVLIDYADHDIYYECSQVGNCHRHVDAGSTSTSTRFGENHSKRITTDTPVILDPTDHDVLYFGGNVLDRSTDGGLTFHRISPRGNYLTGPVPPNEVDHGPFYGNEYATITWIAPAKTDPNTIYVGTDTGRLWKTTDLGGHWTEFTDKGLPTRWVNSIVVDPTDTDHVYVAYSGYREGDLSANVWETTDGGQSWQNVSGSLPNSPVEMLTYDAGHHRLFAATDLGVFVDRNGSWLRLGHDLPNTPVLDVKLSGDGNTLFAATFGRSVWSIPVGG